MNKTVPIPEHALQCLQLLNNAGYEAFLVGGFVRDFLLHRPNHDLDITTNALPEQTGEVFRNFPVIKTGIAHGTVTVLIDKDPVEITTYRTDTTYTDHRHPDRVLFTTSLKEDCARRDFTINAMGYSPTLGICDFFGGQEDLEKQIIRTVGSPDRRFEEDALRILRGIRFMAQLGFTVEQDTDNAMFAHKEQLCYVSTERIMTEFFKTIEASFADNAFRQYRSILEVFLPELKQLDTMQWEELCSAFQYAPQNAELRFSLLLKPIKDTLPKDFFRRMKISNQTEKTVNQYLRHIDFPMNTLPEIRHILTTLSIPFEDLLNMKKLLDPKLPYEQIMLMVKGIRMRDDCVRISQLAVNGNDLKGIGFTGPSIAKGLSEALDAVIEERCPNEKDALLKYLKA